MSNMFCAKLKEVLKMKQEYLSKWGQQQLEKDAKTVNDNKRK